LNGNPGQGCAPANAAGIGCGGLGGASYFGGSGLGAYAGAAGGVAPGYGSGGGGGGVTSSGISGSGGGSSGFVDAIIPNPAATYSYTVGAGGAGGTGSYAGGKGGDGFIEVTEYYYPLASVPVSSLYITTQNSSGATVLFEDSTTVSSTFTFNGSGGTSGAVTVYCNRVGKVATIFVSAAAVATAGTASATFSSNTSIPLGYRPISNNFTSCAVNESGATLASLGMAGISTSGIITLYKSANGAAWGNGAAVSGIAGPFSISYPVA
jgi:hypothetical protein